MKHDPRIHRRRSIRLQGYDYSQAGAYFVTICAQHRECLFGEIVSGEIRLNEAGLMILRWYAELENKFNDIQCDEFVCMPNHIHFIVVNVGADLRVRPDGDPRVRPENRGRPADQVRPDSVPGQTRGEHAGSPLHGVVQWFKTMTTNEYIRGVKQSDWLPFPGKLWQRNYWEHIIRNEPELTRIREYIQNNPVHWE